MSEMGIDTKLHDRWTVDLYLSLSLLSRHVFFFFGVDSVLCYAMLCYIANVDSFSQVPKVI